MKNNKVLVIGTGAWGTALASVLTSNHVQVNMYGNNPSEVASLKEGKLACFGDKDLGFTPHLVSSNLYELMEDVKYVVFAVPTQTYSEVTQLIKPFITKEMTLIVASKGLEPTSGLELDVYLEQTFKQNPICLLLGPGFAKEVINKEKTSINAVAKDIAVATDVANLFSNHDFLVIPMTDNIGASICSSFKNALAILFGMSDALNVSINTKSAILSMAMNEIHQYLLKHKADQNTVNELCGIGDIFLTCSSNLSRNYQFGQAIAKKSVDEALKEMKTVEGYKFVNTFFNNKKGNADELVIFYTVYLLVNGKLKPQAAVDYIWEQYYEKNK